MGRRHRRARPGRPAGHWPARSARCRHHCHCRPRPACRGGGSGSPWVWEREREQWLACFALAFSTQPPLNTQKNAPSPAQRNPPPHPAPVKLAAPARMMPMITPNRPSADPKISTTRILTKSAGLAASDSAADEPTMPTQRL